MVHQLLPSFLQELRHGLARAPAPVRPIRLFLTDVDGVLTDGGMYYSDDGRELKKFNTVDGKAFELLRRKGLRTGIVTASLSPLISARARKIGSDYLYEGAVDKLPIVEAAGASCAVVRHRVDRCDQTRACPWLEAAGRG